MYLLKVSSIFSAAHKIEGHLGKCGGIHGHNYEVRVTLRAEKLNKLGMAYDFADVKKITNPIIESLDHKLLNELPTFKIANRRIYI